VISSPLGLVAPMTCPPFTPPPPRTTFEAAGKWSRPARSLMTGVRPKSPIQITSVDDRRPRPARSSMSAPAAARSFARSLTHERSLKKETGSLTPNFGVTQHDDVVRFVFNLRNATGRRVEVKFPSGQAYDFVVVDSVGREVWRWAAGRIFTQSVQAKLLRAGDSISIAEEWPKARAGKFKAIAVLHSTNFPVQQEAEFERK
jgi:hypothetical protein